MIALPPLLGYPDFPGMQAVIDRAIADLEALEAGGVDGVCVENDYDRPHQITVGTEVVASFARVANEVSRKAKVPVGVQVLLNDWRATLSIAKVIDASFVRLDFFVDEVRIQAGIIDPDPVSIIAYRKTIKAENIALFTDIQVKHSELLQTGKPLTTSARQAISHAADALILTGKLTGESPILDDLRSVRDAVGSFPILIGSGVNSANVPDLFKYADGAIVGTTFKNSMAPEERVIPEKVKGLMEIVGRARAGARRVKQ